jgi:hypothetical protein
MQRVSCGIDTDSSALCSARCADTLALPLRAHYGATGGRRASLAAAAAVIEVRLRVDASSVAQLETVETLEAAFAGAAGARVGGRRARVLTSSAVGHIARNIHAQANAGLFAFRTLPSADPGIADFVRTTTLAATTTMSVAEAGIDAGSIAIGEPGIASDGARGCLAARFTVRWSIAHVAAGPTVARVCRQVLT